MIFVYRPIGDGVLYGDKAVHEHAVKLEPFELRYQFVLQTSLIPRAGIGCFSMDNIPEGIQLNPGYEENFRKLREEEVPDAYLKYCILLPCGRYLSPQNFLKMGVFWYINHAREPLLSFSSGTLVTTRPVERGSELTLYYSDLLTHPKNKQWVQPDHIR